MTDGSFYPADIVLANADLPYVYDELLPHGREANHIKKLGYTCSALVFHWGMDAVLPGLAKEGITDFEKHIKFEKVYNPVTWQNPPGKWRPAGFDFSQACSREDN